jgi:HNH endonuclease
MTRSRGILSPRHSFSEVEKELVRRHYADSLTSDLATATGLSEDQIHRLARQLGVKKGRGLIVQMAREKMADPGHPARLHRFTKGITPANKGKKMPEGWSPGRMRETQFPKGNRPHTWVPVGSYRVNPDGYLELKLNDLPGPYYVRWKPVHRMVWEEAHGPIPEGHVVRFKEGRRTAVLELITLDAIECITLAENARRNSIHNMPPHLKAATVLRAQLTRQINKRARKDQES